MQTWYWTHAFLFPLLFLSTPLLYHAARIQPETSEWKGKKINILVQRFQPRERTMVSTALWQIWFSPPLPELFTELPAPPQNLLWGFWLFFFSCILPNFLSISLLFLDLFFNRKGSRLDLRAGLSKAPSPQSKDLWLWAQSLRQTESGSLWQASTGAFGACGEGLPGSQGHLPTPALAVVRGVIPRVFSPHSIAHGRWETGVGRTSSLGWDTCPRPEHALFFLI